MRHQADPNLPSAAQRARRTIQLPTRRPAPPRPAPPKPHPSAVFPARAPPAGRRTPHRRCTSSPLPLCNSWRSRTPPAAPAARLSSTGVQNVKFELVPNAGPTAFGRFRADKIHGRIGVTSTAQVHSSENDPVGASRPETASAPLQGDLARCRRANYTVENSASANDPAGPTRHPAVVRARASGPPPPPRGHVRPRARGAR